MGSVFYPPWQEVLEGLLVHLGLDLMSDRKSRVPTCLERNGTESSWDGGDCVLIKVVLFCF